MFFGWFRRKREKRELHQYKSIIILNHSSGPVEIEVRGVSSSHVAYIANRVKQTFSTGGSGAGGKSTTYSQADIDEVWKAFDSVCKK